MQGIAQQILSNPAKYSVAQLQRGVQDGVIPAYIGIPLIQDKMQQQKQAQAAGAGQQGQQPPIAEQVMNEASQMEHSGVDQLPTNLPQSYAGGGIIAFEGGGSSNKYETVYDRYNRLKNEAAAQADAERAAQAQAQGIMPYGQQMSNLGSFLGSIPGTALKTLVSAPGYGFNKDEAPASKPGATPTAADLGPVPGTTDKEVLGGKPATPPVATGGIGNLPAAGNAAPGGAPGIGGLPGAGGAGAFGMPEKPKYDKSLEQTARDEFQGLGDRANTRIDQLIEAQSKNKLEGKAYEGLEASLRKEAEDAGMEKADAKAMAIFKAGLAMMGGTSRYAFENIGKGAMVGAEDYQKAAADLKKAEKERQKQFAAIEQARRAEDQDDIKLRNSQLDKAYTAKQRMDELGTNAIMTGTGKDRDTATEIWKAEFGGAKTIQAAQIGAGATLGAAKISADTRVQAAELRAALAGGEKGGLTQDQIIKWRTQLADHPTITAYKNDLVKQYGKNVVNQPQYQKAVTQKIDELLAQMANRNPGALAGPTSGASPVQSFLATNPSFAQYFK